MNIAGAIFLPPTVLKTLSRNVFFTHYVELLLSGKEL